MKERVLISTHDLERAGALRDAFQEHDFTVELVTSREVLDPSDDTHLLVLTGPLNGDAEPDLLRQARSRENLAVMAFLSDVATLPSELP